LTSFLILILFNICIHSTNVLAIGIQDRTSIDDNYNIDELFDMKSIQSEDIELARRGVWSRLFRNEISSPHKINNFPHPPPSAYNYALKSGQVALLPYDKRTIPLELRKALYAHGIVGRRR
jgi:hypothetical protein